MTYIVRWHRRLLTLIHATFHVWAISAIAEPHVHDSRAILPGSPPTQQQIQFARFPANVYVSDVPEQFPINEFSWIKFGNFELGYTDRIFLRGLVLSTHRYEITTGDEMAEISPIDIVIGWQRMSDPAVVSKIHIRQTNRFYYWRVEDFPIPRDEIELTSTNLHLIASHTEQVKQLLNIRPGDIISLEGYLTDVKNPDGFIWSTSRVRDDHGDGACEIVLVNRLSIIHSLSLETTTRINE